MSRVACLLAPDLSLQALVRADPSLRGVPLAVTDAPRRGGASRSAEPGLTARVIAVNAIAASTGVRIGQTAAQARATSLRLVVRAAQAEAIEAARAALFDAGLGFAPRVEPIGDAVLMEVSDLGRLYPREGELALAMRARARHVGLRVGVGIASSKGVARVAAACGAAAVRAWNEESLEEEIQLVPAEGEAEFVAPLPPSALVEAAGLDGREAAEVIAALMRWGVESAGRLAQLDEREVALRLGAPGARLHRLARGLCDEPLQPRAPSDELEEGASLDFAVCELEPLAFVLRSLIDRLLFRLAARHLACAALSLRLRLDGGGVDARDVPLAASTSDPGTLLTLLRLDIERSPPGDGVVGITLCARAASARPDQLDLFRPPGPAPDALATTVAKLQALLGDGNVGSPRPVDTHREEAIAVGPFIPPRPRGKRPPKQWTDAFRDEDDASEGAEGGTWESDDPAADRIGPRRAPDADGPRIPLAFRRLRPEPPIEVILDGSAAPQSITGPGLQCRVRAAAGPFRAEGEWWSERPFARDYWDLHATDGALYRVYRDAESRWYLAGYYD